MIERGGRTGKTIRAALFGGGKMAVHHARAIRLQENAILASVADPYRPRERFVEPVWNGVGIYSSPEALLLDVKPDVVHVCTPPETHGPLARLALQHGAHVYVEKPFALCSKDAADIISMAADLGLRVCAGHQLLFEPPALRADEFLKQIGRVVHIESYFSFKPVRRSRDGKTAISAVEQLIDILPHPTYLLLHFLKGDGHDRHIPVEICALEVETSGNVHGIVRCADVTGYLTVTLEGRPVESYVKVAGTNGCLYADFVRGTMISFPGPGVSSISKVLYPFRMSRLVWYETTVSLLRRVSRRQKSYPGLFEMIGGFYNSIRSASPPPVDDASILDTVAICEEAGKRLRRKEQEENSIAETKFSRMESELAPPDPLRGGVLVTGGTGLLGKSVASRLRSGNWRTRVVSRKAPSYSSRIPGVEYREADLSEKISPDILNGISVVVHCAAETAGGKEAHERNSLGATRKLLDAMSEAGVEKLIHISSIAVLKTSREWGGPLAEDTPLALDDEGRGPYVWGKAKSEQLAAEMGRKSGIDIRIIRPGPLVSYESFDPPGRLGREFGPYFVMVGSPRSKISLCSIETASAVIGKYVESFDSMPKILNLIEPNPPDRAELVSYLLRTRPDLTVVRLPMSAVWILSHILKLAQKVIYRKKKPLDLYAAFASEKYDHRIASEVIAGI